MPRCARERRRRAGLKPGVSVANSGIRIRNNANPSRGDGRRPIETKRCVIVLSPLFRGLFKNELIPEFRYASLRAVFRRPSGPPVTRAYIAVEPPFWDLELGIWDFRAAE